jgi:CheY-like chemotaxis protein
MAGELILVVEDDRPSRDLLDDFLTYRGYRVICAATGGESVALAARERPSLVLMDIRMPGMGGLAATRTLRADPAFARLKIVAVTASGTRSELESYESVRFDAVFLKPLDLLEVERTISRMLQPSDQ